jgi:hypothetical protein
LTGNTVYSQGFAVLSSPRQPTVSYPGTLTTDIFNGGDTTKYITGTITSSSPGDTLSYQIGMFVNGVNTDNITPGWQTVTLTGGSYNINYHWIVENTISSSNCKVGIWVKDCAGNVSSLGYSPNYFRIVDIVKPTVTILWPTQGSVHYAGQTDNVTWIQTDNVPGNLSFSIFLSTNGGTNNVLIGGPTTSIQGLNYIYYTVPQTSVTLTNCIITDNVSDSEQRPDIYGNPPNTQTTRSGTFTIVSPQQPIVSSVSVPTAGYPWGIATTQNVTFAASDPSSTSALLNYEIDLSTDGSTYYPVTTLSKQAQGTITASIPVPDITAAPWNYSPSSLPDNNAKIRIIATNPSSGQSGANVGFAFTISAASFAVETSVPITLRAGWNLVSLPLVPTNTSIQNILGSVSTNINIVWTANGGGAGGGGSSNTQWYYWPGGGLTTMVDGKAYWIQTNLTGSNTVSFTFQGRKGNPPPSAPPTYSFANGATSTYGTTNIPGWYPVGYKSESTHTVATYAGPSSSGSTTIYTLPVWGFDAVNQVYTTLYSTDNMTTGQGYWIYYNSSGSITPPND